MNASRPALASGPQSNGLIAVRRLIEILLARPAGFLLAIVAATALALGAIVSGFEIESDIADAIKGRSTAYDDFLAFEDQFGAPSKDEVFMVKAPDLGAGGRLAALEDLVIELSLAEGVLGVMSLFSLPDPDGEAPSYLTRAEFAGLGDAAKLDRLHAASPLARQLLSPDRTTTLISLIPDRSLPQEARDAALAAALAYADPGLEITPIGLSALQRAVSKGLIDDLMFLLPMVIVICLVVSLAVFRSWRAALVCTIPAIIGLVWSFGAMSALGIAFTAVLAISPAVIVVLGISDAIHLYNAIARRDPGTPMNEAIVDGVVETFPAVFLATLTTVLAFTSLRLVGSPTMTDLAYVGSIGLGLTLVAVLLTVPLASRYLIAAPSGARAMVAFGGVSRIAVRLLRYRRGVAVVSLAALLALLYAQTRTVPGFTVTDHVPYRAEIRDALDALQEKLPGSDQLFVIVEAADETPGVTAADVARLQSASAALYGGARVFPDDLGELPSENASVQRFLGADSAAFALPVASNLIDTWTETLELADDVSRRLEAAGLAEHSTVTGYMVMASTEVPILVWDMRTAFYIAVGMVTLVAAVFLRSVPLALVSLVPNLIPILGVEAWLAVLDRPLTITGAIGLTIAFGIAVDDTIHLLNRLRIARSGTGPPSRAEIAEALGATVPPVVTTSAILFAGLGMTAFSALPSAALFGQLVAGAMVLALLADLFLFPSLMAWWDRSEEETR